MGDGAPDEAYAGAFSLTERDELSEVGVGIVEMRSDQPGYFNGLGARVSSALLDRGLLLRPLGNVLYFMPPYAITRKETEWAISQIAEVLAGSSERL